MVSPNKVCAICGKGYKKAVRRSHSMRATKVRLQPNLQWLKIPDSKRIKACARCIKSVSRGKIKLPERALS